VIDPDHVVIGAYRPFCKQWVYMDADLNEVMSSQPAIFPTDGSQNLAIVTTGPGARRDFSALMVDAVPNLHHQDSGQSFPRYTFEPAGDQSSLIDSPASGNYTRTDNVTESTLRRFRERYDDDSITTDDIFFYVYGALHSPAYRLRFAGELRRTLARIPLLDDFDAYATAGRDLSNLHVGYEQFEPFELDEMSTSAVKDPATRYRVEKMRFGPSKDRTTVVYNAHLTLNGIPERAYGYEVNGRPAIEWIIDRYQVRTDPDSGIANDPNVYSDEPRYIIDLLRRIITVSLKTLAITDRLQELETPAG
jgi:predicted helicase